MKRLAFILIGLLSLGCDNFEKKFYDRIDQGEINAIKNGSDTLDLSTITDFEWDSVILIRGNESVPTYSEEIEEMINRRSSDIYWKDINNTENTKLRYKTSDLETFKDRFYFLTPDKNIIEKEIESGRHEHRPPFELNYCFTDSIEESHWLSESYWLSKEECKFIVKCSARTIGHGAVMLFPDCVTKFSATDNKFRDN